MGRIISTDTGGKQRTILTRTIMHACRQYIPEQKPQNEILDIAAYIFHNLSAIEYSLDATVSAWERRDYWVKADKFRSEWSWAGKYANKLDDALKSENWAQISQTVREIQRFLYKVNLSPQNRIGEPWVGSWERYTKLKNP